MVKRVRRLFSHRLEFYLLVSLVVVVWILRLLAGVRDKFLKCFFFADKFD